MTCCINTFYIQTILHSKRSKPKPFCIQSDQNHLEFHAAKASQAKRLSGPHKKQCDGGKKRASGPRKARQC
jgi:hypothetical protein